MGSEKELGDAPSKTSHPTLSLNDRLALFADQILDWVWEGYDVEGVDAQDLAERLGLIRVVSFDPDQHEDHNGVGAEPGDDWYVFSDELRAAASAATARQKATQDGARTQKDHPHAD